MDSENSNNGATSPNLTILAQYTKDLSFENPGAPRSLQARDKAPAININVNVNANPLSDTDFDVVLTLNAEAKEGDKTVFHTSSWSMAASSGSPVSRRSTCFRFSSSSARACSSRSPARSSPTSRATVASRR
jgi:hypothetical protein